MLVSRSSQRSIVESEFSRVDGEFVLPSKTPQHYTFSKTILRCRGIEEDRGSNPGFHAAPYVILVFVSLHSTADPRRPAFGEYNDLVLEVAGERGETVAIWDFEYVYQLR